MRLLKISIKLIILFIILSIIITPLIFLIYGLETEPLVGEGKKLTLNDVTRVKQLLKQNDPRHLKAGDIKNISFTERDINLFLNYALSYTPDNKKIYAQIFLNNNLAIAHITAILPHNSFGDYLNISILFTQSTNIVAIKRLKIGELNIPQWLLNLSLRFGHRYLKRYNKYNEIKQSINSIKNISLYNSHVSITYQWNPETMLRIQEQGRKLLLPDADRIRLIEYQKHLSKISHSLNGNKVSLSKFLSPLFNFAQERTAMNNDPIAENRALIISLAVYSTKRNITRIIGNINDAGYHPPKKMDLLLKDRNDLALHFLVSAAITVSGGSGLANLAGVFKEMNDSQGGSGFSFADLAADRAGVKMAEIAISSSRSAKKLQQKMAGYLSESDYMPTIDNLPEGITELEFKHKYNDLDSTTYQKIDNEISHRISQCRIYM